MAIMSSSSSEEKGGSGPKRISKRNVAKYGEAFERETRSYLNRKYTPTAGDLNAAKIKQKAAIPSLCKGTKASTVCDWADRAGEALVWTDDPAAQLTWDAATVREILHGIVLLYRGKTEAADDDFDFFQIKKGEDAEEAATRFTAIVKRCSDIEIDSLRSRTKWAEAWAAEDSYVFDKINEILKQAEQTFEATVKVTEAALIAVQSKKRIARKARAPEKKAATGKKERAAAAAAWLRQRKKYSVSSSSSDSDDSDATLAAATAGLSVDDIKELVSETVRAEMAALRKELRSFREEVKTLAADSVEQTKKLRDFERSAAQQQQPVTPAPASYSQAAKQPAGTAAQAGGYPAPFTGARQWRRIDESTAVCRNCGVVGHFARNCPSRNMKSSTVKAAMAAAADPTDEDVAHFGEDCMAFAMAQYEARGEAIAAANQKGRDLVKEAKKKAEKHLSKEKKRWDTRSRKPERKHHPLQSDSDDDFTEVKRKKKKRPKSKKKGDCGSNNSDSLTPPHVQSGQHQNIRSAANAPLIQSQTDSNRFSALSEIQQQEHSYTSRRQFIQDVAASIIIEDGSMPESAHSSTTPLLKTTQKNKTSGPGGRIAAEVFDSLSDVRLVLKGCLVSVIAVVAFCMLATILTVGICTVLAKTFGADDETQATLQQILQTGGIKIQLNSTGFSTQHASWTLEQLQEHQVGLYQWFDIIAPWAFITLWYLAQYHTNLNNNGASSTMRRGNRAQKNSRTTPLTHLCRPHHTPTLTVWGVLAAVFSLLAATQLGRSSVVHVAGAATTAGGYISQLQPLLLVAAVWAMTMLHSTVIKPLAQYDVSTALGTIQAATRTATQAITGALSSAQAVVIGQSIVYGNASLISSNAAAATTTVAVSLYHVAQAVLSAPVFKGRMSLVPLLFILMCAVTVQGDASASLSQSYAVQTASEKFHSCMVKTELYNGSSADIVLDATSQTQSVIADTGAGWSYLRQSVALALQLPLTKLKSVQRLVVADGRTLQGPTHSVSPHFKFANSSQPDRPYCHDFQVMDSSSAPNILGNDFWVKQKALFDLANRRILLNAGTAEENVIPFTCTQSDRQFTLASAFDPKHVGKRVYVPDHYTHATVTAVT